MRLASVCSGIGGAELAFQGLATHAFASEIEPFPRAVLRHHYPDLTIHGDFRTIPATAGPVDILVGGTPCQSFSVAGLRGGVADARGNLALEYLRLADRLRPRWVLWENVPGVLSSADGRDFGAFLGGLAECGYGWAYRVLDAQHFGLAQRRKRVFVVGCLGDWRRAAAVLFEPASLRGDSAPGRAERQGIANALTERADRGGTNSEGQRLVAPAVRGNPYSDHAGDEGRLVAPTIPSRRTAGGGLGTDFDCDGGLIAYGGNNTSGSIDLATAVRAHGGPHGRLDLGSETFVAHSLRADGFDASEDGTGRGTPLTPAGSLVRRLTPTECERLQGFSDGWTAIPWRGGMAADGPRYRAIGNAFAVPVVRWIARRIAAEHAALGDLEAAA